MTYSLLCSNYWFQSVLSSIVSLTNVAHLDVSVIVVIKPNISIKMQFGAVLFVCKCFYYCLIFLSYFDYFTRNPDVLSRRQRRRQQKLLSRKEEFSGGMC